MNITGSIDLINANKIEGWIADAESPQESLEVVLKYQGEVLASVLANRYREDVKKTGLHNTGCCGFVFQNVKILEKWELIWTDITIEHRRSGSILEPNEKLKQDLQYLIIDEYINHHKPSNTSRKCYLHVGMHKTGSSSIQKSLNNHDFKGDTKYLNIGFENHSIPFYSLFSNFPEHYHIHQRSNRSFYECIKLNLEYLTKIEEELVHSTENIIISGEDISVLSVEKLRLLEKYLKLFFSDIEVIIYVRPPYSYMVSDFQERIKGGMSGEGFDLLTGGNIYPKYKATVSKFDMIFGEDYVKVRLFDKSKLAQGDVLQDFTQTLGLTDKVKSILANESLSLEETSVIYVFNKYYIKNRNITEDINLKLTRLRALIKPLARNSLKVSSTLISGIITENRDDIGWISKRVGVGVSALIPSNIDTDGMIIDRPEQLENIAQKQMIKLLLQSNHSCRGDVKELIQRVISVFL